MTSEHIITTGIITCVAMIDHLHHSIETLIANYVTATTQVCDVCVYYV